MEGARFYKMINPIMHYHWGTKGRNAYIPKLIGIVPDPETPWAEMWMSTHPKAFSEIITPQERIKLDSPSIRESLLGNKFKDGFPFILKVISVGETLSIQMHPDKIKAKELHEKDPLNYPDSNHKPEIAIAIDEAKVFVGFKKEEELEDLIGVLQDLKPFAEISSPGKLRKKLFENLIKLALESPKEVESFIEKVKEAILKHPFKEKTLFISLGEQYKGDVGLLIALLLKLHTLRKGEGIFIPPGIPHAYIRGNLVEVMANSDNVVRIGLTPKFKDLESALEVVNYEKEPLIFSPLGKEYFEYDVSLDEFQVIRWYIARKSFSIEKELDKNFAVGILLEGVLKTPDGDIFRKGDALLIAQGATKIFLEPLEIPLEFFLVTVP